MLRNNRPQHEGEAGSGMVEFALVCAFLLLLVFGIMDMGRALFAYDFLSQSTRQATRWAMVRGSSCSTDLPGCTPGQNGQDNGARIGDVANYVRSLAVGGIDTSQLTITGECTVGVDPAQPLPCAPGQKVWIQVQYNFSFFSPFTPATWTMSSRSEMTVSQ